MMHRTLPENWPEGWLVAADLLRCRREALDVSLDVLADTTRIGRSHLAAMEAARFDRCGAAIYAIGFARATARALDLAEAPVVAAIRAGYAERTAAPPSAAPVVPPRRLLPNLGIAATVALLLSLLPVIRS